MQFDEGESDAETPVGTMRAFLRDQFAAAALTGLLAGGSASSDEYLASRCWQIADCMLARREADTKGVKT